MAYLDENLIHLQMNVDTKEELFEKLAIELFEKGVVEKGYLGELKKREKIFPTGIQIKNYGFAIPHTEIRYVNRKQLSFATLKKPIIFNSMENPNNEIYVNLIFMLAMDTAHEHIQVLQNIMKLCQDEKYIKILSDTNDMKEAKRILNIAGIK